MRLAITCGALAALALGGCDWLGGADSGKPRPGLWEWTPKAEFYEMKGMPDSVVAKLRAGPPQQPTWRKCLTAEDAKKSFADLARATGDEACTFGKVTESGNAFSGTVNCARGTAGMAGDGTVNGTVTSETIAIRVEVPMKVPMLGEGASVRMRVTHDGKRIGECDPAKETKK